MNETASFTRPQKVSLALTLCAGYVIGATLGLPAPFLPQMNERHGFASDWTGWMISAFSFAYLASLPFAAKFNVRLGLYEMTCCASLMVGCCTALFGMIAYFPVIQSNETDWVYMIIVLIIRAFCGLGCGILDNTCMSMNTLFYPGHKVSVLAYFETALSVGMVTSPLVASGLYKLGGFAFVFVGFGAFELILTILMFCFLPKIAQGDEENDKPDSFLSLLSRPRLTASLIAMVLAGLLLSAVDPILEPELRTKYGFTPEISALCFVAIGGVYGLSAPIIGYFLNKQCCIDAIPMMGIGTIIAAFACLLIGPTPILPHYERPLWLTLICLGMLGLSCSLIALATLAEVYSDKNGSSNTATSSVKSSLWAGSFSAGALLGPLISGHINKVTNFAWATTCISGICLVFLIAAATVYCCTKVLSRDCLNRARRGGKKDYEAI